MKMCDFGISGYLVDSVAKTMDAGCKPYMAVSGSWALPGRVLCPSGALNFLPEEGPAAQPGPPGSSLLLPFVIGPMGVGELPSRPPRVLREGHLGRGAAWQDWGLHLEPPVLASISAFSSASREVGR